MKKTSAISNYVFQYRKRIILITFLLVISVTGVGILSFRNSTSSISNNPKKIVSYFQNKENGLIRDKELKGIQYSLMYLSVELRKVKEGTEIKEDGYQYYSLLLKLKENKDFLKTVASGRSYDEILQYTAFYMQNDFKLIQGNQTLPCVLYHMDRTYGLSNEVKVQLVFEKGSDLKADRTILFDDQLSGNGIVGFTIKSIDIENYENNL